MAGYKKLMILGGSRYILPVIEAAHELGCYVITADYLPDNVAHRFSDEYCNVSIIDKDAVLERAKELAIDGIMSFAADPGVVTAAYVAEQMSLPFQGSYEAVDTLQNKAKFRQFLLDHQFNCPRYIKVGSPDEALEKLKDLSFPLIVKPVDSAGSKGVTKLEMQQQIGEAVQNALAFSRSGECIIEEFIAQDGYSSDSDGFSIDGVFRCVSFTDQLFDKECDNPYAPSAYVMPSTMPVEKQEELVAELNRLARLLDLRTGIYNIETRVGINGKAYIMEVSPRGGGNRLAEMLRYATSIDLVKASVCAALGFRVDEFAPMEFESVWYQGILHSLHGGRFMGVSLPDKVASENLEEIQSWIRPDSRVEGFSAANHAFGTIFLHYPDRDSLDGVDEMLRNSICIENGQEDA